MTTMVPTTEKTSDAQNLAARVLGKAVDPRGLSRLFDLWPDAVVWVRHFNSRHDGVDLKCTRVTIEEFADGRAMRGFVLAQAYCRLDRDVWNRRRGIGLAFRRALLRVKRLEEEGGNG